MKADELAGRRCEPCRGGVPPLGSARVRELLEAAPEWEAYANETRIRRAISFPSFPAAIEFVGRVAELAEEQGHHPDFEIRGREVGVIFYTHAIGGLHDNDFIMAAKVDRLLAERG